MRPHLWQTLKGQTIPGLSTHATRRVPAAIGCFPSAKGQGPAIDATPLLRAHSQSDEPAQGSVETHWNALLAVSNRHHQQHISPHASSHRQSVKRYCPYGIRWPHCLIPANHRNHQLTGLLPVAVLAVAPSNRGSHETAGVHQHLKTGVPNRQPRQTMPTDVSKRRIDIADHWTREDRRCQETVPVGHRNRLCAMKYQRLETGVVGHHPRQTISANANRWHPCISKTLPVDWRHHSQAVPSIRGNRYRNEQPFGTASDGVRRSW